MREGLKMLIKLLSGGGCVLLKEIYLNISQFLNKARIYLLKL